MPIDVEIEQAIVLAAKFTLANGQVQIEFNPHPQLASSNMLRLLRDRCEELLAERAETIKPKCISEIENSNQHTNIRKLMAQQW